MHEGNNKVAFMM